MKKVSLTWLNGFIILADLFLNGFNVNASTIEEAVDNNTLVFTTGGDAQWYYQTSITHDGEDAARSGKIGNNRKSWLRTYVQGSGRLSFWWKCDTGNSLFNEDPVYFKIDSKTESKIFGERDWRNVTSEIRGNGTHEIEWIYEKDDLGAFISRADCAWVDSVQWIPMVTIKLDPQGGIVTSSELFLERNVRYGYALPYPSYKNRVFKGWFTSPAGGIRVYSNSLTPEQDITLYAQWENLSYVINDRDYSLNPSISFSHLYTGGDGLWMDNVLSPVYDGSYSFQSASITNNQSTWMETAVNGRGVISFYWKPSTEENYDFCTFTIDGENKKSTSGIANSWEGNRFRIADDGYHVFRWTYSKDVGKYSGSDCMWVDKIEWKPEVSAVFYGNGGTVYGFDTYTNIWYVSESSYVTIPSPYRSGYSFVGWFDSPHDGESRIDENSMITDTPGQSKYYAHWQYDVPVSWHEIAMDINGVYEAEADGSFTINLQSITSSRFEPKFSVKGLPAGLKYDQRTKKITGKATKPGVYIVTVSATNAMVLKPFVETFALTVPNLACESLPNLEQAMDAYGTIYAGVAIDPSLVDCTVNDGWVVKVSGLPPGLKWDADVGAITGVPSKSGTYTVTFKTSKNGEMPQTATITLTVGSLPVWAQGTFTGCVGDNINCGNATLTVSSTGRISGKFAYAGTSWTLSASSYAQTVCCNDIDWGVWERGDFGIRDIEDPIFVISAVAKARSVTIPVIMFLAHEPVPGDNALNNATIAGFVEDFDDLPILMRRNMWKDKATASAAKSVLSDWTGTYTAQLLRDEYSGLPGENPGDCCGYLSITVAADGTVKASGKLGDGTSISSSSPLLYDPNTEGYSIDEGGYNWYSVVYASPSSYKGGAFLALLGFNGPRGTIASKFFPDMYSSGMWHNLNPTSGYNYGEGFSLDFYINGAYYDKLAKLSDYYDAMRVNIFAPELRYTFKETVLGVSGHKQTETWAEYAESQNLSAQSGLVVGINGKGTGFLVEKTTRPVQDKVTKQWIYNGANDGGLTLSFTQATGIFKGAYTFWYGYVSAFDNTTGKATNAHNSKKVNFEGIFVQGADGLKGFYSWEATGGEEKTYKFKMPYPVWLTPLQ
ncbi:MAG: InlB B-repeat-containing protein [Kiritimatiellae bacterium]|nr:InlB B-repeat-containing protein [Kiritimatiellia bacterium]